MKSILAVTAAASLLASPAFAQAAPRKSVAPPLMKKYAPALADYTDNVLFGDVWIRPALAPRDRSLITVSALIATGKAEQLEGHLGRALDNGVRPSEVAGIVTHLAFYTGWPNAVSSLSVVDSVFQKRGIAPAAWATTDTPGPVPVGDAARADLVEKTVAPTAPKLAAMTNDVLFADLWRRTDLAPRDRSLVTIAALAAAGDADQLEFHIRHGIRNGLSRDQVAEALTHLAFYAGWPKAMAAVAVLARVAPAGTATAGERVRVVPPAADPKPGEATHFTGDVTASSAFEGSGGSRLGGATVTFKPGARTNWHVHPLGQLLVVTDGIGFVQDENGPRRTMRRGDTVWTAPGVKHWHGASATTAMTHTAISEAVAGESVAWLEPVSDAVYRDQAARSD